MNKPAAPASFHEPTSLEAAFAARVTARLSQHAEATRPAVAERLRFARERALERAHAARRVEQPPARSGFSRSLALGRGNARWWVRLTAMLPLVALLAGLVLIQDRHVDAQVAAAAEIDTALLADKLPPAAYADAGFLEFLKVSSRD